MLALCGGWAAVALLAGPGLTRPSDTHQRAAASMSAGAAAANEVSALDPLAEPSRRIFCNRALNMKQIQAVGFDLDYTLAEYIPETFDQLAYDGAVRKLLAMGYPDEIKTFRYDPYAYQRGLVIDKKRGNLVKLDRHKYAKVAYHGLSLLPSERRKAIYAQRFENSLTFSPPDFTSVDTAFQLVDVALFAQLVDLKDRVPGSIKQPYDEIYANVRRAVDLCHCDGEIKDPVAVDPAKYIKPSPHLARMLSQLRAGGTKVFLLTNSLFDYTEVVCRFLLGDDWLDHFDLAICGARKPGFLLDPYLPLFQVRTEDASLVNIEVGSAESAQQVLQQGKVFQGGNWNHLHRMLELTTGSGLLYVGDHMYSDILRSKRTLGWRTLLIVPELTEEIEQADSSADKYATLSELRAERAEVDVLVSDVQMQQMALDDDGAPDAEALASRLAELRERQLGLSDEMARITLEHHSHFHPSWGQLFKAGHQNSRWAQQVQDYACLYTSHASNLAFIAPDTAFRALTDLMPHDREE